MWNASSREQRLIQQNRCFSHTIFFKYLHTVQHWCFKITLDECHLHWSNCSGLSLSLWAKRKCSLHELVLWLHQNTVTSYNLQRSSTIQLYYWYSSKLWCHLTKPTHKGVAGKCIGQSLPKMDGEPRDGRNGNEIRMEEVKKVCFIDEHKA